MYIAKDKDGSCFAYEKKPRRNKSGEFCTQSVHDSWMPVSKNMCKILTFKNSPKKVTGFIFKG